MAEKLNLCLETKEDQEVEIHYDNKYFLLKINLPKCRYALVRIAASLLIINDS